MKKPIPPKPLFLERMQKLLEDSDDFQRYLETIKKEPLNSIRCNTLKISPEKLKGKLEKKSWSIKQPYEKFPEIMIVEGKTTKMTIPQKEKTTNPKFTINKSASEASERVGGWEHLIPLSPGELGSNLEHQLGYYYIQGISSMMPVLTLNPQPDETVLDLCASPGSKTTQIASMMENTSTIIANEMKFGRIKILLVNLQRCGVSNVITTKEEGRMLCKKLANKIYFDKILIDAPCSGEGVIRSDQKTFAMWNQKKIKSFSKIQKRLVQSAIEVLKPDGELVYSTCTHSPEENEEVVDFILKEFPEMKLEKINLPLKTREGIVEWESKSKKKTVPVLGNKLGVGADWGGGWGTKQSEKTRDVDVKKFPPELKKCVRIYPQDNNTGGFFIAKFRREK